MLVDLIMYLHRKANGLMDCLNCGNCLKGHELQHLETYHFICLGGFH